LYQYKQLDLPGIGVFQVDASIPVPDATDKNFDQFIQQIRYIQKPVTAPDEAFISFIRNATGKIKPLAESDLDSFLSDGKISLNTGKPFHFEGIGSLLKSRSGVYVFTPGEPLSDTLETYFGEMNDESLKKRSVYEEVHVQEGNGLRKTLIGLSLVGGLALAIWGGYSMYNRNAGPAFSADHDLVSDTTAASGLTQPADTAKPLRDSVVPAAASPESPAIVDRPPVALVAAGSYKFIIEKTTNPVRANKRFAQLKSYFKDIRMETKDSLSYSLYFRLPAEFSDTTRIKDSLKRHYGSKIVYIEP